MKRKLDRWNRMYEREWVKKLIKYRKIIRGNYKKCRVQFWNKINRNFWKLNKRLMKQWPSERSKQNRE